MPESVTYVPGMKCHLCARKHTAGAARRVRVWLQAGATTGRITSAVLGVAASVVGYAMVADWFAPLLVLTRRGRPRR